MNTDPKDPVLAAAEQLLRSHRNGSPKFDAIRALRAALAEQPAADTWTLTSPDGRRYEVAAPATTPPHEVDAMAKRLIWPVANDWEEIGDLIASVADNLGDMPISDEYAAKTAERAWQLMERNNYFRTPAQPAAPMVDMVPPATARDRWMDELRADWPAGPPTGQPAASGEAPSDDSAWQIMLMATAAKSGHPGTIALAAQLVGAAPCEKCGYMRTHCRCASHPPAQPTPVEFLSEIADAFERTIQTQDGRTLAAMIREGVTALDSHVEYAMVKPLKPVSWQPIETAPKSTHAGGNAHIEAVYFLGFCPDKEAVDLESCICVCWWEPLMNKGKGCWYGEGMYPLHPTRWTPLPPPPTDT